MSISITAQSCDANKRIDLFINQYIKITHGNICKLIRKRKVFINDHKVHDINQRIFDGDHILIKAEVEKYKTTDIDFIPQPIIDKFINRIVYKSNDIIIFDKPHGIAVQYQKNADYTVDHILMSAYGANTRTAHRIDKDTSGLLIVTQNRDAAKNISAIFRKRAITKIYLAVTSNVPTNDAGLIVTNHSKTITNDITRYEHDKDGKDGKIAITMYYTIKDNTNCGTLIVAFPYTGRTHQIRSHLAYIKCPIIGDFRYGGSKNLSKHMQLIHYRAIIPTLQIDVKCQTLPDYFVSNIDLNTLDNHIENILKRYAVDQQMINDIKDNDIIQNCFYPIQ